MALEKIENAEEVPFQAPKALNGITPAWPMKCPETVIYHTKPTLVRRTPSTREKIHDDDMPGKKKKNK